MSAQKLEIVLQRFNLDRVQQALLYNSLVDLPPDRLLFALEHLNRAFASLDRLREYARSNFSESVRPLNEVLARIATVRRLLQNTPESYDAASEATWIALRTAEDGPLDNEHVRLAVPLLGQLSTAIRKLVSSTLTMDWRVLAVCNFRCLVSINILSERSGRYNLERAIGNIGQALPAAHAAGMFGSRSYLFEESLLRELRRVTLAIPDDPADCPPKAHLDLDPQQLSRRLDVVLNAADTLRGFALIEMGRNSIASALSASSRSADYYAAALDHSRLVPARRVITAHRSALGIVLRAQLIHRLRGQPANAEVMALINSACEVLESLTPSDYSAANMRYDTPTDIIKIKALMAGLAIDPSKIEMRKRIEEELGSALLKTGANPTPFRMVIELYRDILGKPDEGIVFLDVVLQSAKSDDTSAAMFIQRAKDTLQLAPNTAGETSLTAGLEGAICGLARDPDNSDALNAVLQAYLRDQAISPHIGRLHVFGSTSCPLFHAAILAVFSVDGFVMEDPVTPASRLILNLLRVNAEDRDLAEEVAFDKPLKFTIEALSKFYYDRGKRNLNESDLTRCANLLQFGLAYTSDVFWSTRLAAVKSLQGDYREASRLIESALLHNRTDPILLLEKAKLAVRLEDFNQAVMILESLISGARGDIHPAVNGLLAFVWYEQGLRKRSAQIWRSILNRNETDWRAAFGLAQILVQEPDSRGEAVKLWMRCISLQADESEGIGETIAWRAARSVAAQLRGGAEYLWPSSGASEELESSLSGLTTEALLLLLQAIEVFGNSSLNTINTLQRAADGRGSPALERQFAHVLMTYSIECALTGTDVSEIEPLVEWCRQRGVLGDLFAGAKGTYRRALLRLASIPYRMEAFKDRMRNAEPFDDHAFGRLIDHISTSGWVPNYYKQAYALTGHMRMLRTSDLTKLLRRVALEVAYKLRMTSRDDNELIEFPAAKAFWIINEDIRGEKSKIAPMVGWTDGDLLNYAHHKYKGRLFDWTLERCEWVTHLPPTFADAAPLREGGIHFRPLRDSAQSGNYIYSIQTSPEWGLNANLAGIS